MNLGTKRTKTNGKIRKRPDKNAVDFSRSFARNMPTNCSVLVQFCRITRARPRLKSVALLPWRFRHFALLAAKKLFVGNH